MPEGRRREATSDHIGHELRAVQRSRGCVGRPRTGGRQQSGARTAAGHGVGASVKDVSWHFLVKPWSCCFDRKSLLEEVPIIALEASAGAFAALRKDGVIPRRFSTSCRAN